MALDLETIYGLVARKELSVEGAKVLLSSPRAATDTAAPAGTGVGPRAADSGPIAVIGMSGRFPGADDLEAFWENLALGRSAITEVPRERWDVSTYYDPDPTVPDRTRCKWGGFLRDVDRFDPLFFNISGKEAELADPQQRLFLEEAWKALEDAGYSDTALEGRRCGVFVGTGSGDYTYTMKDHGVPADPYAFMGNAVSILAARISYVLNLKGPSIAVDTACSSSLVALHLACQSILMGESELALAGGVFVSTHPSFHYLTGRAGMLSPEGRCKAFDDGADGFVPGEGVGVVVLKPLARALADGDHVYGVIRASGVNQDGRTNGITAPSAVSQAELEQEVYRRAGISPETISYVEAHGTGTRLGDPIEVHALTKAFRASTDRKQFCALGSVKTNIGHASTAAGIAGVIKVLLSLKYRQLAPSLNFDTPNTHIPFAETPFFVNTALRAWMPEPGVPRRAAVSSFGLSGTNAHVLIEEAPGAEPRRAQEARRFHLAVVSAKTEEALAARLRDLERWLERYPGECDVRDLCATLALGRAQFPVRAAFVVSTAADLRAQLQAQRESGEEQARKTNLGRKRPVGPGRDPVLRERARALLEELRASPEAGEPAWARLAEVYLAPQDIDWSELYPTGTWRRVPLPTYPFARERYWAFAAEEPSYFVPEWQPTPGDMGGAESPPSLLIVLDDTGARLEALRRAAAERWAQVPRIVWVKPGRTFAALEDGFELDPARAEDWKRLGTALGGPGARMGVLHFGGLADPYQAEPLARVRSMLVLVRALAGGSEARLLYFHRSTPEAPLPGDAAVAGLLRAVPALEPRLRLSTIGLSAGEVDRVATIAVEELSAPESAELCHVEGRRLRRTYVPVSLPTSMPLPVVKQGAVVLITGGAGALGVAIGRHLAATSGAKLVLTGSAPEPTHQEAIQSLRAGGAEVLYVSADVRDETAMAAVVAEAKRRFGRLDGVIHAAGRLGGVLLNQKDDAALERVLAPKVLGACVLDTVTGDEPLDFFVLYSSIASVLGDFGQCDYAVANRFLDEFAAQRERRRSAGERSGTTVSINWPLWQATGMVTPSDATELYLRNAGLRLLTVEKGARAFERALTLERAQVLVLDGETEKLPRLLAAAPARVSAPAEPSPPPLSPQAEVHMQRTSEVMPAMDDIHALEQATLREVTAILAGLLKLPTHRLPPDAHLSEFGIDSILIKDLTERINQRFGVSLTPALFFSLSTLAGISKHLVTGPGAVAVSRAPAVSPAPTPPAPLPPPVPAPPVAPAPAPRSARPRVRAEGPEPVAIIGASGVFPQSADLETFWRNLEAERDLVTEVPPERWDWRRHYNTTEAGVSRTNSKWGGFMPDVDKFDAAFFNISPREAAFLDPQARLFLETTWKTIEDAGYRASALAGRPVGLFVGAQLQEYIGLMGNLSSLGEAQAQAVLGNTHTMIANRVSYLLDLRGPSEAIDTACSSALVALYRAVRSIQSGECELAIAGGVSAMLSAETFALASQLGMLSPEGRCKTFDKSANGYVKGEGVGAVLLKPLSRAVADGDHVYAVVRGVAINHGGKANSLTAPNPAAQAELLIQAYSEAGIDPKTVTYVETHGTGTELGDPVEVDGLKRAFKALTGGEGGNAWCGLGAVKSNIGHLEPAAGIASLVKVMLALRHKRLPATLHVRDLNPYLQLDGSPFYLVTRTQEWKALTDGDGRPSPRRAGISSFGFGGSNAHAVLEEYVEDVPPPSREEESPQLLVLSARDEERLKHAAERLLQHLEHQRELSLADVAFTLQCGREPMGARLALVARTRAEAMSRLGAWLQGREAEGVSSGRARGSEARSALLDRSEELTEFVRALVQRGKLAKLGALWVEGGEVDWSLLHAGARRKRLPLPTYPFARVRHWFDTRRPVEAPRPAAPAPSVEPVVPKFEPVVPKSEPAFAAPVPAPRQLAPVVPSRSGESLKRELTELLAAALYLRPSEIDEGTSFAELGVDSILAVELVKQMNQRFGLELKATRLYDYPCIRDLAGYLATVVGDMAAAPIPVAEAPEVQAPPPRAEPAVRLVEVTSRGPGEGGPATLERVSSLVAGVLGVPVSQVDVRASLLQLGLEMAQAAELARRLRSQLGVELQPIRLYDFANVEELASHVGYRQQPVPAPVVESRPAAPVQSLPPAPAVSAAPMARRSVESIQRELTEMFAAALYLRPEEIGEGTSFAELGVDSILAVELVKQMNQRFGLELKATRLYDYPCIRDLAGYLATVGVSAAPVVAEPRAQVPQAVPAVQPVAPVALPSREGARGPPGPLVAMVAEVLAIPPGEVSLSSSLLELGFDRARSSELARRLRERLGVELKPSRLFDFANLGELADYVASRKARPPVPVESPSQREAVLSAPVSLPRDAIAITGMSARYPGAGELREFWANLLGGVDSITEVPPDRWDINAYYDPDPNAHNRTYCRRGGFLGEIDKFDPLFFSISGWEAELMDPQQRIFLEEAWRALEDAGYPDQALARSRCGTFVGVAGGDYTTQLPTDGQTHFNGPLMLGNVTSILAARIAHFLNLKGPAVAIETACSSALVAVHLACQSLRLGECDLAIAGGVCVMTSPQAHVMTSQARMLSPEGKCKTFDDSADGFVPSEGVGLVVLKPLARALADGDHVYAVIRGSGINHDGRTNGITAPSSLSQTELETEVYQSSGVDPATIGAVEAHGTGTKLGDPIELEALTQAFRKYTARTGYCAIGSVKTNIGHTLAAAGAAGLIKMALSVKDGKLPPSLHFSRPNQHIDFAGSPFFVNTTLRDWPSLPGAPRRGAVSSFGLSGTNAHLVLEEAPALPVRPRPMPCHVFPFSAKTQPALAQYVADFERWLSGEGRDADPRDVSYTLTEGRSHHGFRAAVVASDLAQLHREVQALRRTLVEGTPAPAELYVGTPGARRPVQNGGGEVAEAWAVRSDALAYRKALGTLARHYVTGGAVDWKPLFDGQGARRLSMPTHPFLRRRYWVNSAKEAAPAQAPVPSRSLLLDAAVASSDGVSFEKRLSPGDVILKDHVVGGHPMLPGVACLEMARAAGSRLEGRGPVTRIRGLVWLSPVIVREDRRIVVTCREAQGGVAFQLSGDGQALAEGHLEYGRPEEAARLDLSAIRGRCSRHIEGGEVYRLLRGAGIVHGPYFQKLESIQIGEAEALGRIQLGRELEPSLQEYGLHPAILDATLQATLGLMVPGKTGGPMLPFAIGELTLLAPLVPECFAYIRRGGAAGADAARFDVLLVDGQGRPLVDIRDFRMRGRAGPRAETDSEGLLYLRPAWWQRPLPVSTETLAGDILVVRPENDLGLTSGLVAAFGRERVRELLLGQTLRREGDRVAEVNLRSQQDFKEALTGVAPPAAVYFLGALEPLDEEAHGGLEGLEDAQERGALALVRLIKALDETGVVDATRRAGRTLPIKVLTNDVHRVLETDAIRPRGALVLGVARTLPREYELLVSCVDLASRELAGAPAGERQQQLRAIQDEPGTERERVVAYRGGARYLAAFDKLELREPPTARPPYREMGVYLIIGGAGGLGLTFARHLVTAFRARLVLVSRSAPDARRQAVFRELEALGGEVLYLQADVADRTRLAGVLAQAKERFGRLDGVIHSAFILRDSLLARLEEGTFREVLSAKVRGSVVLAELLRNEPLDFLAFFSSTTSFTAGPGQAAYSAASCFQDAFAGYLGHGRGLPVRTINWGFWGEVGAVSGGEYQERAARLGVTPISPEEGTDACGRILASGLGQVAVFKAEPRILQALGAEFLPRVRHQAGQGVELTGPASEAALAAAAAAPERSLDWSAMRSASQALDEVARELLARAFLRMTGLSAPGEHFLLEPLADRLGIPARSLRLLRALCGILERGGVLERQGAGWAVSERVAEPAFHRRMDSLDERVRAFSATPVVQMMERGMAHLQDILSGRTSATEILFSGGSADLVEQAYRSNPLRAWISRMSAAAVRRAVEVALARGTSPVRILEVGAGTGATTTGVLRELAELGHRVEYHFTDVSLAFVRRGEERLASQFPFVRFSALDITQDVAPQGFERGRFDLVIADNVLHATRRMDETLHHVKSLLREGGLLLVHEQMELQEPLTLTFGLLTHGWWSFEDAEVRLPDGPLLDARRWGAALSLAGFRNIRTLAPGEAAAEAAAEASSRLLLAESDGWVAERWVGPAAAAEVRALAPESRPGSPAATADALQYVRSTLAAVLRIPEADIRGDARLDEFGVDSLVALEVSRRLSQDLGPLPRTLLFDHPSVDQLAAYLMAHHLPGATAVKDTGGAGAPRKAVPGTASPLVPIQQEGKGPPLFLVHGVMGEADWLTRLAHALGSSHPVYGLESRGFDGLQAPLTAIEAMAASYLDAMTAVQPEGPYILGGVSMGGVIAFEMARQLQERGGRASHLLLFDSMAPASRGLESLRLISDKRLMLVLIGNGLAARRGIPAAVTVEHVVGDDLPSRARNVAEVLAPKLGEDAGTLTTRLVNAARVFEANSTAMDRYKPERYSGETRVVLFRADAGFALRDNAFQLPAMAAEMEADRGWSGWVSSPVEILPHACDHFALMSPPALQDVARDLEAVLAPAKGRGRGREEILEVVRDAVRRVLPEVPPEGVSLHTSLKALGASSLDRVEVATLCMEALGTRIPPARLSQVTGISSLVDVLHASQERG